MSEQDFSKRLTIVVRNDVAGWESTNAVAHIAAYIGHKLENTFGTAEFFTAADGTQYPRNSQYPFIIKSAENTSQLHALLEAVRTSGLLHHVFIREMIETTDDAEIAGIVSKKTTAEIELLGIGVFGPHEEVNALTKKFSLWK